MNVRQRLIGLGATLFLALLALIADGGSTTPASAGTQVPVQMTTTTTGY